MREGKEEALQQKRVLGPAFRFEERMLRERRRSARERERARSRAAHPHDWTGARAMPCGDPP